MQKKKIDGKNRLEYYSEGDIWWCSLGVNVGYEQDGKGFGFQRPVLIVKGLSKEICLVVPLTTSTRKDKYKISLGKINNQDNKAHISQIRALDTKRLKEKLGKLDQATFENIRKSIRELF